MGATDAGTIDIRIDRLLPYEHASIRLGEPVFVRAISSVG